MKYEPKIKVIIRKRPLNKKEQERNQKDIIQIVDPSLIIHAEKQKLDLTKYVEQVRFDFDRTFSESISNLQIYQSVVQPLIREFFQGVTVTCFAYGQTGSGKTYTMMGSDTHPGLYSLASNEIFHLIREQNLFIGVSFFDIYCGKLHDLLNNRKECKLRADSQENMRVSGLAEKIVKNQ